MHADVDIRGGQQLPASHHLSGQPPPTSHRLSGQPVPARHRLSGLIDSAAVVGAAAAADDITGFKKAGPHSHSSLVIGFRDENT